MTAHWRPSCEPRFEILPRDWPTIALAFGVVVFLDCLLIGALA